MQVTSDELARVIYPNQTTARDILLRLFRDCKVNFAVNLGHTPLVSFGTAPPAFVVTLNRVEALRKLILSSDTLVHVESYLSGAMEIEGDIYAVLEMRDFLAQVKLTLGEKFALMRAALALRDESGAPVTPAASWSRMKTLFVRSHSRSMDQQSIRFHYDISNDFFKLWLDRNMVYSCAYFPTPEATLDEAQEAKLDLICRKLCLKPGDRLLDIGCGWGALVMWAATHYGVKAHGVTLSRNQYTYAAEKIRKAGLADRVTVEIRDYRDIEGEEVYDGIASVGMFEHVGIKKLPAYFATVHRLLKADGLFLNHGITESKEVGMKAAGEQFVRRYVFPNCELDFLSNTLKTMEQGQFEIHDIESLRAHYALTLRQWVTRLEERAGEAHRIVPASAYKVWRLYMAGCARDFEAAGMGVYQVLAAKRRPRLLPVPLTRTYMTGGG